MRDKPKSLPERYVQALADALMRAHVLRRAIEKHKRGNTNLSLTNLDLWRALEDEETSR